MSSRLPPKAAWCRAENLAWRDTWWGCQRAAPTPQVLVFHTRPILGASRAGLLAHCGTPPGRGSAEQPGSGMKGLSVWAERTVCLACPPSRPRGGGRGSRSLRAPIL